MVVCISTLAIVYNTPLQLLWLLSGTVILLKVLQVEFNYLYRYIWKLLPLFLLLLVVQSVFSRGGEVLLMVGTIPLVTDYGLLQGLNVIIRMFVIIASAVLLVSTSSRDIVLGLVQWKVPYEIAFMFSIALHFLPGFREEMINVVTAIQLRGIELKKIPWGKRIALYTSLIYPVVYGAVLKAQQFSVAMETRGFRVFPQRTYLRRLRFCLLDYALLLIFPVMTVLLIVQTIQR